MEMGEGLQPHMHPNQVAYFTPDMAYYGAAQPAMMIPPPVATLPQQTMMPQQQ